MIVLGINVDEAGADDRVKKFLSKNPLPYSVWRDPDDRASRQFDLTSLPGTFLLDRNGRVIWSRKGIISSNEPELEEAIEHLL